MKLFRYLLILAILPVSNLYASSSCLKEVELKELSEDFDQFEEFLSGKAEYCERDLGEQWYKIAHALVTLKKASSSAAKVDPQDAFTHEAITEKDWWSYFTKDDNEFVIQDDCAPNVIAYVSSFRALTYMRRFFGSGKINLCKPFFNVTNSRRVSVLMHERRHFDDHPHVNCKRGINSGARYSCDDRITDGGSYAVSVQVLVSLARSQDIPAQEKALIEAEATYMAFNRFNTVPKVKVNLSMLLSNSVGEVYQWIIGESTKLVKTLAAPAVLHSSNRGRNLTVFPTDTTLDAYRMDNSLRAKVSGIGLFAEYYNSLSIGQKNEVKSTSFKGTAGILKGNSLATYCDKKSEDLGVKDLDRIAAMNSIVTLPKQGSFYESESFLLSNSGDLFPFECKSKKSKTVKVGKPTMRMDSSLIDTLHLVSLGTEHFAIKGDGSLVKVLNEDGLFKEEELSMPIDNSDWISGTPMMTPEVF